MPAIISNKEDFLYYQKKPIVYSEVLPPTNPDGARQLEVIFEDAARIALGIVKGAIPEHLQKNTLGHLCVRIFLRDV